MSKKIRLTDTTPEADAVLLQLLRQAPVWRKWELMSQLNDMTRSLALGDLRDRYPQSDEVDLNRLLADRLLGAALAETVYGPSPNLDNQIDEL
jgi:hypothetical protein